MTPAPGAIPGNLLEALGGTNRLAKGLQVPVTRANDIVRGKGAITADTALRLARYFGTTAQLWMNKTAPGGEIQSAAGAQSSAQKKTPQPSPLTCTINLFRLGRDSSGRLAARGNAVTNINGKAYAMNAVTPMKPWKTPILKLVFFLLGAIKPLQNKLIDLSFIHFARWVVVKRSQFPKLAPSQSPEELDYDYLLFFSNFNGTWNQYIDAFSDVLAYGLNLIWRWSEKFPGSIPITPFKRYISLVQFDTDYYYDSYPYAAINDVKAALRVDDAVRLFAEGSEKLTPAQFQQAYLELLVKVQPDLGTLGPAPVGT